MPFQAGNTCVVDKGLENSAKSVYYPVQGTDAKTQENSVYTKFWIPSNMRKRKMILMMLLSILVAGCKDIADLRVVSTPKSSALVATCDGTRINWNYCYEAASKLCPGGFEVSDQREIPDAKIIADRTQVSRTMYFKCK